MSDGSLARRDRKEKPKNPAHSFHPIFRSQLITIALISFPLGRDNTDLTVFWCRCPFCSSRGCWWGWGRRAAIPSIQTGSSGCPRRRPLPPGILSPDWECFGNLPAAARGRSPAETAVRSLKAQQNTWAFDFSPVKKWTDQNWTQTPEAATTTAADYAARNQ